MLPFIVLGGILAVVTTPGLIAQHLEARKAKAEQAEETGA